MGVSRLFLWAAISSAPLFFCASAQAIDPSRVLVVYNNASAEGLEIANYYAQTHPGVQLLGLDNLSTATTITAQEYLTNVRVPVLAALTPTTDVIVTTMGMPLKIHVETPNPISYTDVYGASRFVFSWKTESSLESELARIDFIGNPAMPLQSERMMGDQSLIPFGNFPENPYYENTGPFTHAEQGTRLTSRLDGFTVSDVTAAIDRAQNAFVGPNNTPGGPFHFVVDDTPEHSDYGQPMERLVTDVLAPAGLPHSYENTAAFVGTADGPVLGYTSHGAHQSGTPPYNFDPENGPVGSYVMDGLDVTLADGAIFNSWESFNAQSFTFGGNYGNQALIAEWLAKGGTAGVGNVAEPGTAVSQVVNEDLLFSMMLDGFSFAEAAWSATYQLSYANTVVGDPLMTWKQLLAGDATMDGVVDTADLAVMGPYWGQSVDGGGYSWSKGDLNGDGFVDVWDLTRVSSTWGQVSSWAVGPANLTSPDSPMAAALFASMHPNPEPSTVALMSIGLVSLAAFAWRRRRRDHKLAV